MPFPPKNRRLFCRRSPAAVAVACSSLLALPAAAAVRRREVAVAAVAVACSSCHAVACSSCRQLPLGLPQRIFGDLGGAIGLFQWETGAVHRD